MMKINESEASIYSRIVFISLQDEGYVIELIMCRLITYSSASGLLL